MAEFSGFSPDLIVFLRNLRDNNTTGWFKAHRDGYEYYLLDPAREFILALGERLRDVAPDIIYDPRINRSIFRLNRDTRFSADKTPYKTHLALWFWEGAGKRMDCSGFYFHLESDSFMLGTGIYCFNPKLLERYRETVADKRTGAALVRAIADVAAGGDYRLGGEHYKRVPRGYDASHERADLLRYNGLYVGIDGPVPGEMFSSGIVDYCVERFRAMLPVHRWLVKLTEG